MSRNPAIAKIKILQKELGLDDDTYRALLERETGKRSATELDHVECGRVIEALQRRKDPRFAEDRAAMIKKARALLWNSGRNWSGAAHLHSYLDSMAKAMFGIEKHEWCKPDQLHAIVAACQIDTNRKEAKDG